MSDFDQLEEALRARLHASVEDLHPSAELSAAVEAISSGGRLPSRLSRRVLPRLSPRRIAFAVPVPLAGIAAAAWLLFAAGGPSSSIAGGIIVLPGGSIRVFPAQLSDPAAANAVLRRHHIRTVVVVPMTASCRFHDWTYTRGLDKVKGLSSGYIFMTPHTGRKGYTTVIAAKQLTSVTLLTAVDHFPAGRLPTCASSRPTGPVIRAPGAASRPNAK